MNEYRMIRVLIISVIFCILQSCNNTPISISSNPDEGGYSENDIIIKRDSVYKVLPVRFEDGIQFWEEEVQSDHVLSGAIELATGLFKRASGQDMAWSKKLKADIYMPNDELTGRPLIIFIHGGGFLIGQKDDVLAKVFCMEFAKRGYVCASIDYRLMNPIAPSFIKGGYVATQDALSAFKYFYQNADTYGIDQEKIVFAGVSAGAVTALNAAFLDENESILGREGKLDAMFGVMRDSSDFPQVKPAAVVNISGAVFDLEILKNNDIPVISFHGTSDDVLSNRHTLPFDDYSERFNNLLDRIRSYFSSASEEVQNAVNRELEEARIPKVYGSQEIDAILNKNEIYSVYVPFQPDIDDLSRGGEHTLMLSHSGTLRRDGIEIINKTSEFLYDLLK